ncbi:hypothetical protein DVH05_000285 [Phytophthora capsici]|nr:hypothetical protein DVH05_000285 [Phytophthora capsici]
MEAICRSLLRPGTSIDRWGVLAIRKIFIRFGVPEKEALTQLKTFFDRNTGFIDKERIERAFGSGVQRLGNTGPRSEHQALLVTPAAPDALPDSGSPAIRANVLNTLSDPGSPANESAPNTLPDPGAPANESAPDTLPDPGAPANESAPDTLPDPGAPANESAPNTLPDPGAPANGSAPDTLPDPGSPAIDGTVDTLPDPGSPAIDGTLDNLPDPGSPAIRTNNCATNNFDFPVIRTNASAPDRSPEAHSPANHEAIAPDSEGENTSQGSDNSDDSDDATYVLETEEGEYYCTISNTRYNSAGELATQANWMPTEIPVSSLRRVDRVETDIVRRNERAESRARMRENNEESSESEPDNDGDDSSYIAEDSDSDDND